MNKKFTLGIITAIALTMAFYLAYYLLLRDTLFHSSIACIIADSKGLPVKQHLFVLGLIPVYIGIIIFGAATLGILFGSMLQSWFSHCFKNKKDCLNT